MKKTSFKKIFIWTGATFLFFSAVLAFHIYWVTRQLPPDAQTRIMARIDIKQPITDSDVKNITAWLYQQPGIDHVLCNAKTDIVVFTFSPVKTSADKIVKDFKTAFNYKASRFVPSEKDMQMGCPVAAQSFTYKAYSFIKRFI